jgi:decaprenylphospho-beta-D-erythro-pentofuranosid-2-ulose 2-reductase
LQTILIIGASSAIAKALARIYAGQHKRLYLLARNAAALEEQKNDLMVRGAESVDYAVLDVNDFALHQPTVTQVVETLRTIDLVLICHGTLPDHPRAEHDFGQIQSEFNTNALSVISLLTVLSRQMIDQGHGCLAVITSVAGDRGRQSNYIYGAAKSAVSHYLAGLRGSLLPHHVHVIDIKPGFVDTPMTQNFKKGVLWTQPDAVAKSIVRGISAGRNTIYVPAFWRFVMLIIGSIPEALFKRLKL